MVSICLFFPLVTIVFPLVIIVLPLVTEAFVKSGNNIVLSFFLSLDRSLSYDPGPVKENDFKELQ